jgi:hypothetical protein
MLKQEVQEILDTLKDNLMNKLDRLHHIQVFSIDKEIQYKNNKDLCLVYSIWSHTGYVNVCFYSILSQLCFTDIREYSILVYVDEYIAEYTKSVFKGLIPLENIIVLKGPECAKQRVAIDSRLLDYKVVVMSDADNILQSNNRTNIYKDILSIHNSYKEPIINFLHKYEGGIKTLNDRIHLSNFESKKDYDKLFEELINNLSVNDYWALTGFISYDSKLIELLKKDVEECIPYNIFCDETVWRKCVLKNNITEKSFDELKSYKFVHPENIEIIRNKEDNVMYLVHPFLGNYINRLQLDILYFTKNKFLLNE